MVYVDKTQRVNLGWLHDTYFGEYSEGLSLVKEPTKTNLADLFTKPVSRQVLQTLLGLLTGYHHPSLGQ